MIRTMTIVVLSAALALAAAAAPAAQKQQLDASRSEVAAACDANDGFAWGTGAADGRYGCMTDDAWVECDAQGNCEGGRAARKAPVGRVNPPGPALPL